MDKEMQKALSLDAKKLSDLTGDGHHVYVTCDECYGEGLSIDYEYNTIVCPCCSGEGFITL